MQKTKSNAAVRKAGGSSGKTGNTGNTDKTGKASKARKQLTPEQRERKRLADKARRRRIKQAILAEQARAKQGRSCCGKGCTCGKDGRSGKAGSPVTALDVAAAIGKHVARQVANAMPGRDVVWMSELAGVEPGVARGEVVFSNGARAVVTFVDANAVDPLSRFSPLPPPVKQALFRVRIAKEISDLVDAHANCLVGDCE